MKRTPHYLRTALNIIAAAGARMKTQLLPRRIYVVGALTMATGAAFSTPARAQCAGRQLEVVVNQRSVRIDGATDLLQLLRRHISAYRLSLGEVSPDDQPLVVLDGLGLFGGVRRLTDIPMQDVQSITVLRPLDAMTRYGPRAGKGAIEVATKNTALQRDQVARTSCSSTSRP